MRTTPMEETKTMIERETWLSIRPTPKRRRDYLADARETLKVAVTCFLCLLVLFVTANGMIGFIGGIVNGVELLVLAARRLVG